MHVVIFWACTCTCIYQCYGNDPLGIIVFILLGIILHLLLLYYMYTENSFAKCIPRCIYMLFLWRINSLYNYNYIIA